MDTSELSKRGMGSGQLLDWLPRLTLLRLRVTLRMLEDTQLPAYKGALLRGGFGHAFQRAACPQRCWRQSHACPFDRICPYRWVFETPHPPDLEYLHDLRDVPRPFVVEPPLNRMTRYVAGDTLEFGLVVIGRGRDYLPYFLFAFEHLARMGLGKQHARARLERVEALAPWQPVGRVVYQDGQVLDEDEPLPLLDMTAVAGRAAKLPTVLRVDFHTPLRIKAQGELLKRVVPEALVRALCWRLSALSA
ncbi:MAG: hypothetical protein HC837_17055, partial [Chloroflexaceae bacterium]|nr:hypothetical protein [Chloroflexaceae bacterium]